MLLGDSRIIDDCFYEFLTFEKAHEVIITPNVKDVIFTFFLYGHLIKNISIQNTEPIPPVCIFETSHNMYFATNLRLEYWDVTNVF